MIGRIRETSRLPHTENASVPITTPSRSKGHPERSFISNTSICASARWNTNICTHRANENGRREPLYRDRWRATAPRSSLRTFEGPQIPVSLTVMTSLSFGSPVFCVHQTSMPAQIYQALGSLQPRMRPCLPWGAESCPIQWDAVRTIGEWEAYIVCSPCRLRPWLDSCLQSRSCILVA